MGPQNAPILFSKTLLGEGTIVNARLALCAATFFALLSSTLSPVMAQDSQRGLAPADEYFGHYKLSVLGIANTIRDAGARIDGGTDPSALIAGPLKFATDALHDWEQQYPSDPWIAKDLLALEVVYLRVSSDEGFRLASQTEAWLSADYPDSDQAAQGRSELADNRIPYMPQQTVAQRAIPQPAPPQPAYAQPPQTFSTYSTQPQPRAIPSYAIPWERYAAMHGSYVPFAPYAAYGPYR
jgi:hypothetical protein